MDQATHISLEDRKLLVGMGARIVDMRANGNEDAGVDALGIRWSLPKVFAPSRLGR